MGLTSWKKEFYPNTAEQVVKTGKIKTLIKHSLRKWEGLTEENVVKHGIRINGYGDIATNDGKSGLLIDSSSCSLCIKFYKEFTCTGCPLYEHFGCKCDDEEMPFEHWREYGDPEPMIEALKECLKKLD